jgi:hypothetical protein
MRGQGNLGKVAALTISIRFPCTCPPHRFAKTGLSLLQGDGALARRDAEMGAWAVFPQRVCTTLRQHYLKLFGPIDDAKPMYARPAPVDRPIWTN